MLSFPYDAHLVAAVRTLPGRRFDWDLREWSAPADGWVAAKLTEILRFRPELSRSPEFDEWLANAEQYWVGHVRTARYDGRGWFALDTLAGTPPEALREGAIELEGRWLAPLTPEAAAALTELRDPRLSLGARRCLEALEYGEQPPAARLILTRGVAGERFTLETFWDPEIQAAFEQLPGAAANELKLDAWIVDQLDAFLALHEVEVAPPAAEAIAVLAEQHRAAQRAVAASRATTAEPMAEVAQRLGGVLAPFQWVAVRYALEARRTFLSDEQGLGKTVEALAALEADDAFPAVVVCPASMKLTWEREAARWLPHRSRAVLSGREPEPIGDADITILNYDIVQARLAGLVASGPQALVIDESHYCKNPHAKRTRAMRRLADAVPRRRAAAGADRHAGDEPRRRADRAAARDRAPARVRLGRQLQPPVRGRAQRGAPALASAPPLLRAAAEVRGAAAAAGQAPGRRAGVLEQRGRVPARRGRRDQVAEEPAAGSEGARRQDRRDAAGRAAGAADGAAAPRRPRQARGGADLDPRLPRLG